MLVAALLVSSCAQQQVGRTAPLAPAGAVETPSVVRAWVQADANGGWSVRALTKAASCPELRWSHSGGAGPQSTALTTRAEPSTSPARSGGQPDSKASVFDLRVCEAPVPSGAKELTLGSGPSAVVLPTPSAAPSRLLLLGDTGCRMKASDRAFQDCNNPVAWPFAAVASASAKFKPDLIVHVGDLHYRESPCPADRDGCAGSPWGYGDDAWIADFFEPTAPLLTAAPWVFVRGNHESCARAGHGWFRFFAAGPWTPERSCIDPAHDAIADFTEPFAVDLGQGTQIIAFDSAAASGRPYVNGDPALQRYRERLATATRLAARQPHNFFVNHHPVLGFAGSATGAPRPGVAGLQSAMQLDHPDRLFDARIDWVMGGHFHIFEAVDFKSPHPGALVVGNSGSAAEGWIDTARALAAQPFPGAVVRHISTHEGYGYSVLARHADAWRLQAYNSLGQLVAQCDLVGTQLDCQPSH